VINLTSQQLRQAATIKDEIAVLENELNHILGASAPAVKKASAPGKRKMSAAAKAKISAKLKAAWAKRKAQK
jgi:hypothetical protein